MAKLFGADGHERDSKTGTLAYKLRRAVIRQKAAAVHENSNYIPFDDERAVEPETDGEVARLGFITDEELREFVNHAAELGFCRPYMAVRLRNVLHQVHESHLMYFFPGVSLELSRLYVSLYQEGRLSLDVLSEITSREPLSLRHQSCGEKTDQLISLLLNTYRSQPG